MALSPLQPATDRVIEVDSTATIQPSKTYRLDSNASEIGGLIDGEEALRQFIAKAIRTARYRFMIYNGDYGCEIEDIIGANVSQELLNVEIPRFIREALIYDDRIDDVVDFVITRDSDKVYVAFTVVTADGTNFTEEVAI
jgi:Protein of unknown function (DUF2634)